MRARPTFPPFFILTPFGAASMAEADLLLAPCPPDLAASDICIVAASDSDIYIDDDAAFDDVKSASASAGKPPWGV